MNSARNIDIFITAGGKSARMGQDKGMMLLEGKPMLLYLTDMLQEDGYSFTLIANREEYKKLGFQAVRDIVPDKGPMGALHTAFHYTSKQYVLLLGCDMPFLPAAAVSRMIQAIGNEQVIVAEIMTKINPLCAVYHRALKDKTASCIAENKLKMQDLVLQSNHRIVAMDDLINQYPAAFFNFNEPKDVALWKLLRKAA